MGRSSGYCFKIIACGGSSESVDRDDLDASSENKVTTDKRGWSFRKRSTGHRVLSNTVITEIPFSDDKKSSEPVIANSEAIVSEKTSTNQWIETEEFSRVSTSNTKNSTVSNLVSNEADEDDVKVDSGFEESSIIVIQAAVRRFLAQREVVRLKKVVKLQAVVRGHLVRCRAAGTLRCIQAIVKMQTLVRARNATKSVKRLSIGKKVIQNSKTRSPPKYISIEKLLSSRFANQLLESTPRTKQFNIKCDPSKQDPTWKWLERWMSISSPEVKPLTLTTGPTSPEPEAEPPKRAATEQADSEGRKSVFGSRKPVNPSFISAQSKFEELTSTTATTEPVADVADRPTEPVYESLKVGRTASSECGTELSVTSMLDSPDPSESEHIEFNKESKLLNTESTQSVEEHNLLGTELTHSITYDTNQVTKSSPEKTEPSPTRQIESQQTPPSNLSNNTKTRITDRKESSEKPKVKKSPISRGSLDNLPREGKSGKRRNSFGSQSSEIEQEGRDSGISGSNCVPSYMQVTESARAKALNGSPRLSPDVESKMKKRHSMPGAGAVNGRHGSPRLKRSSPQSQQSGKGSDSRERKWQN